MSDRVFLDTNIIIYAHSDHDLIKQSKAQTIIIEQKTIISTQILQEAANTLNKKLKHTWGDVRRVMIDITSNSTIYTNTAQTILKATNIAEKYHFSFYDCLVIAAAIEAETEILFSEDMQHNQLIENSLRIVNPFK